MGEEETERQWLDPDELEVVRKLLDAGVRFLIVGGRAVQFHGRARPAKDLDLLVELSEENWPKLRMGLRPLNAGVPPLDELSPLRKYHVKLAYYPSVELLTAINGIAFAEAWFESIEATVAGLRVRVLSKAHLIVSKQQSGRSSDADDILGLQET
jgi:predicted nucleotidyltransferase